MMIRRRLVDEIRKCRGHLYCTPVHPDGGLAFRVVKADVVAELECRFGTDVETDLKVYAVGDDTYIDIDHHEGEPT